MTANQFQCMVNNTQYGFEVHSCTLQLTNYMPLYKSIAVFTLSVITFYMLLKGIDSIREWFKGLDIEW